MGLEIERKFLTTGDGWKSQAERVVRMRQGYLNELAAVETGQQKASVRVRISSDTEAHLNLKSREAGHTRQEFEYAIPVADAEALFELCVGGSIDKHRHYVRHAGHLWEVDEFLGDNAGLVVAELELSHADEPFERPDWIGAEVTSLQRYYNLALIGHPYVNWSMAEKSSCS